MTPLRIGLVCPYSLDVPGGAQNHVRDLAEVLIARGHAVEILAPGENSDALPDYVTTAGRSIPVRFNGSVARVAFGPRAVSRVRRWLADGHFDVLHVHEPQSPSVSLIALWQSDVPVVATFHAALPRSRAMSSTAALLRPSLEKISARIAVSEFARETLVSHVGGEPVVIPNGVETHGFAAAEPRAEWTSPGPTIGFLGRVDEPRKGLAVLLRAFPAVRAVYPSARLLVAGRGAVNGPESARVLESFDTTQVELLGQVSDADRARLFASVTVYVAPQTHGESFGIVLIEAMAAGAAVVASDLAPFRAVVAGSGGAELFRAGDPDDLAVVLTGLLGDPARRDGLRFAGAVTAARYDWGNVVGDIEAVYGAVLRASDPARPTHPGEPG